MNIYHIVAIVFTEAVMGALGLLGFYFLFKEFRARRQPHLFLFSLTYLLMFAALGGMFSGELLYAYGFHAVGRALVMLPWYAAVGESVVTLSALTLLYARRQRRVAYLLLTATFGLAALASLLTVPGTFPTVGGMVTFVTTGGDLVRMLVPWMASAVFLMLVPGIRYFYSKRLRVPRQRADVLFAKSGAVGMAMMVGAPIAHYIHLGVAIGFIIVMVSLRQAILIFAAAGKDAPDPVLQKRPSAFVTRSLVAKASVLSGSVFLLLSSALVMITASYFITLSYNAKQEALRKDLRFFTSSYGSYRATLLEQSLRLAADSSVKRLAAGNGSTPSSDLDDILAQSAGRRVFRIVDRTGTIRYSSRSEAEVGVKLSSGLFAQAVMGKRIAAMEKDAATDSWMLQAAVPITLEDGSRGGALLATEMAPVLDFSGYFSIAKQASSGYGFVAKTGEEIYASGPPVDKITKLRFAADASGGATADGGKLSDIIYYVEPVSASDGTPDGLFYVYLSHEQLYAEQFRILTVVTLLMLLTLSVSALIMLFCITRVLKPIQELRAAAAEVARENYNVRVAYNSPDELGRLAEAFNAMGATIGSRTQKLRDMVQEEKDFLSLTAHELRTPLNIFRWTIELMRFGDTGTLTQEQHELLEQMHQTNTRLMTMVQNLLDVSRIGHHKVELRKAAVRIEEIVDDVAGQLAVKIRERNINLHWSHPEKPVPPVWGDRDRVIQIVLNILNNAVKYSHRSGHIEVAVSPVFETVDGKSRPMVKVSVEDNGRGIPKDQQNKVFNRFFRAKNVVKDEVEGTGLGLFITKQLVEIHGGRIWFESTEGQGTTFSFTLPAVDAGAAAGKGSATHNT